MQDFYLTPTATIAWNDLFTAVLPKKPKPTDKPKFSVTMLFTPEAMETAEWKALVESVNECAYEKWGKQQAIDMMAEGIVRSPFRREVKSKGYPAQFARFIGISSNADYPPTIRLWDGSIITDKRDIYPGCLGRASVAPRAYGGPGSEYAAGLSLDLRNVQKLGDGERMKLGGGTDGSEFGKVDAPPAAGTAGGPSIAEMMG